MSVERHDIHQDSVGAYLLGALDEAELQSFEGHLRECPVCRDEVERLRPAVEALPRSVMPVAPPPGLKASLMAEVESDLRQRGEMPARSRVLAAIRHRVTSLGDALAGTRPAVAWVSAAFVLLVGIVMGYGATQVTSGDDARTVAASVDMGTVPTATGSLLVPGDASKGGILRVNGMPTLDRDRVYQVWVRRHGEVIAESLFSVGSGGMGAAAVSEDLEDADAVMVTREPAGGARAPSEQPILTVSL
jgi:anti-sigma-K factor RskA